MIERPRFKILLLVFTLCNIYKLISIYVYTGIDQHDIITEPICQIKKY